ncbi:MAG: hypothetical protein R2682_14115 [Pyrinomonadaceae bacterium]
MQRSNRSLNSTPFLFAKFRTDGIPSTKSATGLEREIADNKTYLERAERNPKHAQNQKEYETAMREVDALQKAIGQAETSIVELMEEGEGVERNSQNAPTRYQALTAAAKPR